MVTTSPRPRHPGAYTILESFVVLGILAILCWLGLALYKYHNKAAGSEKPNPPAHSADAGVAPQSPPPPADSDAQKE